MRKRAGGAITRTRATDPLARARALAERGAFRDACDIAGKILAADPGNWQAKHLMALILWSAQLREKAVALMADAAATAPDDAEIRTQLVSDFMHMAVKSNIMINAAIANAEQTIVRHGPAFSLLEGLATLHLACGSPTEALTVAERLAQTYPGNPKSHFVLSVPLLVLGREEDAIAAYGRGLRPLAKEARPSTAAVKRQYAALAKSYDSNLLHQSFSARMARFLVGIVGATADKRILDVGCGTGLLATHFPAARWVGIDRSPEMLAEARRRGFYAELVEGDMTRVMAERSDRFDIVASSCALYHLADLASFFRESARLLVPGGQLFFSVDPAPDTLDIALTAPGEHAHSRKYLRGLAASHGFAETSIRIMEHRYYAGFWCAFRRKSES